MSRNIFLVLKSIYVGELATFRVLICKWLDRMKNELSWDDEDKLHSFKDNFKNIFQDDWKKNFYEYIGSDINIFDFSKNKKGLTCKIC